MNRLDGWCSHLLFSGHGWPWLDGISLPSASPPGTPWANWAAAKVCLENLVPPGAHVSVAKMRGAETRQHWLDY
jgi:hypothetical protein